MTTLVALGTLLATALHAGPYAPAAGEPGSTAISKDDPAIVAWASGVVSYSPGPNLDEIWEDTSNATGPADGGTDAGVVSLGRGGSIVLGFTRPIADGPGADFAVFENGFKNNSGAAAWFLELAWVEVSTDGVAWARFPSHSLTADPVGGFGSLDPTEIDGLAGKYGAGYGTPFDLADLPTTPGVDVQNIVYVRLVDVVGDGTAKDSAGHVIYDPFPTLLSAGFDLDAVGVLHNPPKPKVELIVQASGGMLAAQLVVTPGYVYHIESSTDRVHWQGVDQWNEPASASATPRAMVFILGPVPTVTTFYRVRVE